MTYNVTAEGKAAWMRQYELLWGGMEWEDDALLVINSADPFKKGGMPSFPVDVYDPEAAWKQIEKIVKRGHNAYVGVAPRRPGSWIEEGRRGTGEEIIGAAALVVDIDCQDGIHKAHMNKDGSVKTPQPNRQQAMEAISACPLDCTVVMSTGGGYHIWIALDRPLYYNNPEDMKILRRFKSWWVNYFAEKGLHLDASVIDSPTGVLRVAGSLNLKFEI